MNFKKLILMLLAFAVMSAHSMTVISYWKEVNGVCYYKCIYDQYYAMYDWCSNFKSAMNAGCSGDCKAVPPVITCPKSKIRDKKCTGHYWSTG